MVEDTVSQCLRTQEPRRYAARIFTLTGELRWVDTWLAVEAGGDGAPLKLMGTAMDITERRQAEEDLAALKAELERRVQERTAEAERANEANSEFLSPTSHELRTPSTPCSASPSSWAWKKCVQTRRRAWSTGRCRRRVPAGAATRRANLHVMADKQRLRQIVVNLLSNAVKYNSEAGTVSFAVSGATTGDSASR